MSPTKRIVTQLPLTALWTEDDELKAVREKYLDKEAIRELLKQTLVEFVVANAGDKLKWIAVDKCKEFWKGEVKDHVVDGSGRIDLDNYPNGYAYLASLWKGDTEIPIILLEKHH